MMRVSYVLLAFYLSQLSAVVLAGSVQGESASPGESIAAQEPVQLEEIAPGPNQSTEQEESPEQPSQEELAQEPAESDEQAEPPPQQETPEPEPSISEEVPQPEPQDPSSGLVFQFTNVPLTTVIDTVMRELGYSYITTSKVGGSASIYTMGEIPRENAFEVLEQLLQMNGMGIVKQPDDMYVIVPLGETTKVPHELIVDPQAPSTVGEQDPQAPAVEQSPAEPGSVQSVPAPQSSQPAPTEAQPVVSALGIPQQEGEEDAGPEGVATYIISLHYVPSADMITLITPFVSNGAQVIDYASANMLMITDFRRNIDQVLKLVELLDTDYFDRTTVDLIPIRYNQATDIATDLAQIFAPSGAAAGVRIVTIERLNSLLVVTRSASVFQEVQRWVEKLDATITSTNIKTFVYQVENNTAGNIADILSQLYQDGVGPSSVQGQPQEGRPMQPGASQREPRVSQPFQGSNLGPTLQGRPISRQPGIQAVVGTDLKIIVNEFNNSLIIQATEADYQFLLQTIKLLDVLPRQVLIEAKLYSVELQDDLSFGVAAFLEKRGTDLGPATIGQISPGGALSVATRAFIGSSRQLEDTINALRNRTNVELLEAPRILAIDGAEAQINIGAEVPVTTASFGDPLQAGTQTNFVNSIQFRPTGVTMLIFPRISASGVVAMDIAIEVSSASGAALTPTINTNSITTSLMVRDGQTVALAGIISDQTSFSRTRVPLLGDIPILGALFGQTTRTRRRAELIFFITPHVIHNLPTATELTLDFKRALQKAYDFVEKTETEERDLIQKRRDQELQNQQ
ncbi:MAG: secretin N-terminal domain-containing protein [Acidobacteriota bacterium]|nr:secretin N-terminal domain-containing protein [Acidobacteriota bacterium]